MRTLFTIGLVTTLSLAAGCQAPKSRLEPFLATDHTALAFGAFPSGGLRVADGKVQHGGRELADALEARLHDATGIKYEIRGDASTHIDVTELDSPEGESFTDDGQSYAWAAVAYRVRISDGDRTYCDGMVTGYASLSEGDWSQHFFEKGLRHMAVEQAAEKLATRLKAASAPPAPPSAPTGPAIAAPTATQPTDTAPVATATEPTHPAQPTETAPATAPDKPKGKSKLPSPE